MKRRNLCNTIMLVFALFCVNRSVIGSVLYPVGIDAYQRPDQDTCRPLADIENLISAHLMLYDTNTERLGVDLRWPAIQMYYNFETNLHLQIVKKDDWADEDDDQPTLDIDHQYVNYKMQYQTGNTGQIRSFIQVFKEESKQNSIYECYQGFSDLREQIYSEQMPGQQLCQIHHYEALVLTPKETLDYLWRPHAQHYTAYIGPVCLNKEADYYDQIKDNLSDSQIENALAFVGTDVEGQMYTSFFDAESLLPFFTTYQTQLITIDPSTSWLPRKASSFKRTEFEVRKCTDPTTGQYLLPELVKNSQDDPLYFAAHYGFLSG